MDEFDARKAAEVHTLGKGAMKNQRGITSVEFGIVMLIAFLCAAVAFGMFWDRKFDCDKRYPSDPQSAFQCLHHND